MKEEMHRTLANVESIKKQILENESTLISVIDSNDLLLTELVGEDVLDEPTKDEILAGKTRSVINQRLLNWLLTLDDLNCFSVFLTKLREAGQSHVANLLDETPGELPLTAATRKRIQKVVRELTSKIDADSILESLFAHLVISADTRDLILSERTKASRAKVLIDSILRGSDKAFEKFEEEVIRSQPDLVGVFESTTASDSSMHVSAVAKHLDVLQRCTDINLLTVAYLRADDVINDATEAKLKAEPSNLDRISQVYSWLRIKSADIFNGFLGVMEKSEQKHVANVLTDNLSGQQPLTEKRFQRLKKVCPILMKGICSPFVIANALRSKQASGDTDFAISFTDCQSITEGNSTTTDKSSRLIDAVLRRTDFTFECFEQALRETKQSHLADYLNEGDVVGVHVNTTRPEMEDDLCKLWNKQLGPISDDETYPIKDQLQNNNLCVIFTESQHSIMVYTYCKTPSNMKHFACLLNCGKLQAIFQNILNGLLRMLEPENFEPLEVAVTLEEEDRMLIKEFTHLEESLEDVKDISCISKAFCQDHYHPMNDYCFDCNEVICSLCATKSHHSHKHSANVEVDCLRQQLRLDLELIEKCKTDSIELKTRLENDEKSFLKRMEESRVTVHKRCDSLKERVERFKETLLRENDAHKERVLGEMSSKRKAIESFLAVFRDYEKYAECLVERGSQAQIQQSFPELHERAEKLQLIASKKNVPTVNIKDLIMRHQAILKELMEPDFGLLDQLHTFGVLTTNALDVIAKLPTPKEKNSAVLEIVLKESKCRELLSTLATTKQTHLVNFIRENGVYKPEFCDDWPVSKELFNLLDRKRPILPLIIDSDDLLSSLCAVKVISLQQKKFISNKPTTEKTNALLDLLRRGSSKDLLTALQQVCIQEMQVNPFVLNFLEDCMFLDLELLEKQLLLSKRQIKAIKTEHVRQKKNAKLLDIILETGNCQQLFVILKNTNQHHIVNFVLGSGVHHSWFGGDWPITLSELEILESSWKYLVENLNSRNLLEKLQAANVITKQQKESIAAIPSFKTRNEELLDIVKHGSLNSFIKMVNCLRLTGQGNIANILAQSPNLNPAQELVNVHVRVNVKFNKEVQELLSSFSELLATCRFHLSV